MPFLVIAQHLMRWQETLYTYPARSVAAAKLIMPFLGDSTATTSFEVQLLQTPTKESSLILVPRLEAWLYLTDINTAWAPLSRAFKHNGNTSNSHAPPRGGGGGCPAQVPPCNGPQMASLAHPEVTCMPCGQCNRCIVCLCSLGITVHNLQWRIMQVCNQSQTFRVKKNKPFF